MIFYTLASSSQGNCTLVCQNDCYILVDAGISLRRITGALKALGLSPEALSAVLVTHAHTDHVAGLPMLIRRFALPVFASQGTAQALRLRCPELGGHLHAFSSGTAFQVENFSVESFPTPHDAPDSVGYRLSDGRRRLAFVTDLGHVTRAVLDGAGGADAVVLEANHDEAMLLNGPYPYPLKRRILGERGHLSNFSSGELAAALARRGAGHIVLAHLSRENNTPERALQATGQALEAAGLFVGRDVNLSIAPKDEPGPCHSI